MKKLVISLTVVILLICILFSACASQSPSPAGKVENLRLVGTIGPLSIPLAYMIEHNSLSSVAKKTTLTIWANPAQLQAVVTGGQGDFISLPTNSAATFYNRSISLKLLDCSIWNILYLVTPDIAIKSVGDLKGKRVVVPYQGAIPDAMFRFVCQKQGINPDVDINIYYAPDPVQASQLLLSGQDRYVLLSEPSATSVILNGKKSGLNLIRAINMKSAWEAVTGGKASPIAGTIALGDILSRLDIIRVFENEYEKAIRWMLDNPVEAGEIGSKVLAEQGFTAEVLSESMRNIDWKFVPARDARPELEAFFSSLAEISPNYTGGKLPDEAFYYGK